LKSGLGEKNTVPGENRFIKSEKTRKLTMNGGGRPSRAQGEFSKENNLPGGSR